MKSYRDTVFARFMCHADVLWGVTPFGMTDSVKKNDQLALQLTGYPTWHQTYPPRPFHPELTARSYYVACCIN